MNRCKNCVYWDKEEAQRKLTAFRLELKFKNIGINNIKKLINKYEQASEELKETEGYLTYESVIKSLPTTEHRFTEKVQNPVSAIKSNNPESLCKRFPKYVERKAMDTCGEFEKKC